MGVPRMARSSSPRRFVLPPVKQQVRDEGNGLSSRPGRPAKWKGYVAPTIPFTLDGLTSLVTALGAAGLVNSGINALCTACAEQETGSAFLTGPDVTDITVQNQCAFDQSDHLEVAADPTALADVLNALDPAAPVRVPCLLVLPVTGPVGPVPSF